MLLLLGLATRPALPWKAEGLTIGTPHNKAPAAFQHCRCWRKLQLRLQSSRTMIPSLLLTLDRLKAAIHFCPLAPQSKAYEGALAPIDPFLFSILTNRGTTSALCFKWCTPIQAAICETSRAYLHLLPASLFMNRFFRRTRSRSAGVPMH